MYGLDGTGAPCNLKPWCNHFLITRDRSLREDIPFGLAASAICFRSCKLFLVTSIVGHHLGSRHLQQGSRRILLSLIPLEDLVTVRARPASTLLMLSRPTGGIIPNLCYSVGPSNPGVSALQD